MAKSFDQKAAAYWGIIRAHPDTSATSIYKRYQGTSMGMRKQDSLSLTKQLKDAAEMTERNENSSMRQVTKTRLRKGVYQAAKKQSMAGKRYHPVKDGVKVRSIRQTITDMYGNATIDEYTEFY